MLVSENATPEETARIMADLDHREKQYDHRLSLDVYGTDGKVIARDAVTYVGTPRGANWAGDAPLPDLASIIATAKGPSGPNYEYLFNLCDALRDIGVIGGVEAELFELEKQVRVLRGAPTGPASAGKL